MKKITQPQIQKNHVMFHKLGLMEDKREIILNFSSGRTESSKELYYNEAFNLIKRLSEYDPVERLKKLIFSLAYQSGIIYGDTDEDKKINAAKLNIFLKQRGAVKKELNIMLYPELIKTHRQFEAIVKSVKKSKEKKLADILVGDLLRELNMSTL